MELGFDIEETEVNAEVEEGAIHNYTLSQMKFPCFVVNLEENPLPRYKLEAIDTMRKTSLKTDNVDAMVFIYFKGKDKTIEIGTILSRQVIPFIDIIGDNNALTGYYDADTELKDDMLMVLATN